ncbi:MAG: peptide chain release factor N(5)-glutamine methyltransferase [Candidatus Saccharimonadales bacterium]
MEIQNALREGEGILKNAGINTARLDSLVLLSFVTRKPKEIILSYPDKKLPALFLKNYRQLLVKRSKYVPLAYLVGHKEFYGLDFKVNESVLVPRPETEALVEYVLQNSPPRGRLLDIGTGSGAIAIAIKKNRPQMEVLASDISEEALSIAKQNSKINKVDVEFVKSDLLNGVDGQFDTITANLPYLEPRPRQISLSTKYEPKRALFGGGHDGLDIYRNFLAQVPKKLKKNGGLILEANPWQHEELINVAKKHNLKFLHREKFILVFYV